MYGLPDFLLIDKLGRYSYSFFMAQLNVNIQTSVKNIYVEKIKLVLAQNLYLNQNWVFQI